MIDDLLINCCKECEDYREEKAIKIMRGIK